MNAGYSLKRLMPKVFYPCYLKYKYKKMMGKSLNLESPKTFTEKMQWAKLHRRDKILTELADKIRVRDWVKAAIGDKYLIPTLGGTYSNPDEIDFSVLPNRYVIKTNNGSGGNIVVEDAGTVNISEIKKQLRLWLDHDYAYNHLELQYKEIIPEIYIEQYLSAEILKDYKFFCFDGRVFCSYTKYTEKDGKEYLGIFDRDYVLMPYYRDGYLPISEQPPKPENYDEMVCIAEKLSSGFSHVRVDLYNIDGKIYFGEMTFTTGGGYLVFHPSDFDMILGKQWDLYSGI